MMTPENAAFVLTSASSRGGAPSEKKRLPVPKQNRNDEQQDLISKPVFEQRRCQRRAAPDDQVRPGLRLDPANALDDVRSKGLDRPPSKTLRPVQPDRDRP